MEDIRKDSDLSLSMISFYDIFSELGVKVFSSIKDKIPKDNEGTLENIEEGILENINEGRIFSFKEKISLSSKFNKVKCQKTLIDDLKNDISQLKQSLASIIQEINNKEKFPHIELEKYRQVEKICNKNEEKIKKMKKTVKINKLKLKTLKKIFCVFDKNSLGKTDINYFLNKKNTMPSPSAYQYKSVNLFLRPKPKPVPRT